MMAGIRISLRCGSPLLLFPRARQFARLFLLSFFIDVRPRFGRSRGRTSFLEKFFLFAAFYRFEKYSW